jgi:hypothetical protein
LAGWLDPVGVRTKDAEPGVETRPRPYCTGLEHSRQARQTENGVAPAERRAQTCRPAGQRTGLQVCSNWLAQFTDWSRRGLHPFTPSSLHHTPRSDPLESLPD